MDSRESQRGISALCCPAQIRSKHHPTGWEVRVLPENAQDPPPASTENLTPRGLAPCAFPLTCRPRSHSIAGRHVQLQGQSTVRIQPGKPRNPGGFSAAKVTPPSLFKPGRPVEDSRDKFEAPAWEACMPWEFCGLLLGWVVIPAGTSHRWAGMVQPVSHFLAPGHWDHFLGLMPGCPRGRRHSSTFASRPCRVYTGATSGTLLACTQDCSARAGWAGSIKPAKGQCGTSADCS